MATVYSGADVSTFQGTINWSSYAGSKSFVIIKAGGGDVGLYTDSHFATNQAGARAQTGLRVGYYFFGDANVGAVTSANYFISAVGALNNGEILVLDIENHSWGTTPDDTWAYNFATTIHAHYGFYPFVYMSQFSPTSSGLSWPTTAAICPFWMANYSLSPTSFSSTSGNADATWGGLGAPDYKILQYSSTGAVAGISGNVDLDTFYSPNNTLLDWDALGYGGSPPPPPPPPAGTLTNATVTNPNMTYSQPAGQSLILPANKTDQVLYSNTWTTTITASSWPQTVAAPATGIGQYAYVVGNFQAVVNGTDVGTNDFGVISTGASGYGQFPGDLPSVFVQPIIDSSGNLSFVTTYAPGGSATITFTFRYALLASSTPSAAPNQGSPKPQAYGNVKAHGTPTKYSTYRRIYFDNTVGSGTTTVAHNLGVVPNMFYWVQDTTGTLEIQPVTWTHSGPLSTRFGLMMNATYINIYVDSANSACRYRTYRDN